MLIHQSDKYQWQQSSSRRNQILGLNVGKRLANLSMFF